jgi:NitT/TauT family transport system substrate-binding protein
VIMKLTAPLARIRRRLSWLASFAAVGTALVSSAFAEVAEVRLARQFGAIYLPIMVMEHQKLIEKQAAAGGISDLKVTWAQFAGPAGMVDAILSNSVDFTAQGVPSLALLWDKTRNGIGVKALAAINESPLYLNTRRADVKSVKDFSENDRIALPSPKVSIQAIYLQMAAEKAFGPGKHTSLDHLTVGMPHPEAMAALMSMQGELTAHFTVDPFHSREIKAGMNPVTTSVEIGGGPASIIVLASTEKFRQANPVVFKVVNAAYGDALAFIAADPKRAAGVYLEMTRDKSTTVEDVAALITAPGFTFTRTPNGIMNLVGFMNRVGTVKTKPGSWKDLFFDEAHALPGN